MIMTKINNIKEGKEYKEYIKRNREAILFQNKIFFSKEEFISFIDEIENGIMLKMPKNSEKHSWYCNFGDFYCDTFVLTEKYIIFFNEEKLIYMKKREKTDDIEMSWKKKDQNTYCSCNPLSYCDELDESFDNASFCKEQIKILNNCGQT